MVFGTFERENKIQEKILKFLAKAFSFARKIFKQTKEF